MRGAFAAVRGCVAVVSIAPGCVAARGAIGPGLPEGGETEAPTSDDMMPRSGVMHVAALAEADKITKRPKAKTYRIALVPLGVSGKRLSMDHVRTGRHGPKL